MSDPHTEAIRQLAECLAKIAVEQFVAMVGRDLLRSFEDQSGLPNGGIVRPSGTSPVLVGMNGPEFTVPRGSRFDSKREGKTK